MFSKNFFFVSFIIIIVLFGGIIALIRAQDPVEALPNEESVIQEEQSKSDPVLKEPTDVITKPHTEPLRFHTRCGKYAQVTNDGRTALRTDLKYNFNFATVLTQRPLEPNELFEVRLERLAPEWYGSLKIGVTVHSPEVLDFPSDMQYVNTGVWMMVSDQYYHNNTSITKLYTENLENLKVGDRAGVMRKDNGTLHFYVNGVDQGEALKDVPADVYGFVDIYGRAAEVSIVDALQ